MYPNTQLFIIGRWRNADGDRALPEVPFGGVKDSGYGAEGGTEAMEPYLVTKVVTHAGAA